MHLQFEKNFPLKKYNTFGVAAYADEYIAISHEEELLALFAQHDFRGKPFLVLGGGSNMLFTQDYKGLVIRMDIQGISHEKKGDEVIVTAGAGVVWNNLVWYCVNHGFAGIENMALIPGTAGASPVQNIGAYGAELMDVFYQCRVFDTQNGEILLFHKADCNFSYRDSVFKKSENKGRYIITQVSLKLSLKPRINTAYGAIRHELSRRGIVKPTIKDIAEVVSEIRVSKLPDPATIGNSGSFFKNPIVSVAFFEHLRTKFADMVFFPLDNKNVKLAAGWLIEQCGWKGKRVGQTGTWKNQALVLVNHKNASGSDIYKLSEQIIADVKTRFGITLEREVNII